MLHNKNKKPLVSIIMPVYNGEKYVADSINSILNQTYKNIEFIIINDGSNDKTSSIISSYKDNRIIFIKNDKNNGIVDSLNYGFSIANGNYIARMDSDDISHLKRIEKQVRFMETNIDIDFCGSWGKDIKTKKYIKTPFSNDEIVATLFFTCPFLHPSMFFRKKIMQKFTNTDQTSKKNINNKNIAFYKCNILYDKNYEFAEDYELWTRLCEKANVANIQESLIFLRFHENNTSLIEKERQRVVVKKIHEKLYLKNKIVFSKEELDCYEDICDFSYKEKINKNIENKEAENYLLLCENVLLKIKSAFLYKKFFLKIIGRYWFLICYQCLKNKFDIFHIYKKSKLTKFYTPNIPDLMRFLVRLSTFYR